MTDPILPSTCLSTGSTPRIALDFCGHSPSTTGVWFDVLQWHRADRPSEIRPLLETVWRATQQGLEAVGWINYEAAPVFDPAFTIHSKPNPVGLPLACFAILDPATKVSLDATPSSLATLTEEMDRWKTSLDYSSFTHQLECVKEAIRCGESYQINLTHGLNSYFDGNPWLWYQALKQEQQAGFSTFIQTDEGAVLCFSPELFFSWDQVAHRVLTKPMKGTIARAPDSKTDLQQARWLYASEKNRAENIMIVDLLRNDLSKIASNVNVTQLFTIEQYATVWQMTSTIEGTLSGEDRWIEVLAALFPCGSIVGAPKLKTAEYIARLESTARGVYCGAIGWVSQQQALFAVPIRTIQWDAISKKAWYGVGNGLTIDSTPEEEWQEVQSKSRFLSSHTPKDWALIETFLWSPEEHFRNLDAHIDRITDSAMYWMWISASQKNSLSQTLRHYLSTLPTQEHWSNPQRIKLFLYPRSRQHLLTTPSVAHRFSEMPPSHDPLFFHVESKSWSWSTPSVPLPIALDNTPIHAEEDRRFLCHKTTRRQRYNQARTQAPEWAWDVLLWNSSENVTEFSLGNIAIEQNGTWYTPPISSGLLPGIARQHALMTGKLKEKNLSISDLRAATHIAFLNSLRGWVPVYLKETIPQEESSHNETIVTLA
jgi:para-aminobenzoate synthetase / 4-amino-4-deoxychorismate lyase